ncbi:MAG: signal peptidase II [Lachnospiraceae bacterium]
MMYAVIAVGIFAGDFFLKRTIDKKRKLGEQTKICQEKIVIQKYYNKGAALNFMEKYPKLLRNFGGVALLLIGIMGYALWKNKKNPSVLLGISFILGGGASNWYDRVTKGYVIDYVSFCTPWKRFNRIVFNISDFFIFLGSLMAVLFS